MPCDAPPHPSDRPRLILGSTSRYRRALLERLGVPFEVVAPDVDETPQDHEAPAALALRLALAKANAVAALHPAACVIGSDQVLDLGGSPMGKPMSHERAREQLIQLSARTVVVHTAVAVVRRSASFVAAETVDVSVRYRNLDARTIEHYLQAEKPYDCAGSTKSEGLGIALIEEIANPDPSALVGLPLIATCRLLRNAGLEVLG